MKPFQNATVLTAPSENRDPRPVRKDESRYVDRVASQLGDTESGGPQLMFMQSNGGLTEAGLFKAKDAILSGPAGGVLASEALARSIGAPRVATLDMGALDRGRPVVADAMFPSAARRAPFVDAARDAGVPLLIVEVTASDGRKFDLGTVATTHWLLPGQSEALEVVFEIPGVGRARQYDIVAKSGPITSAAWGYRTGENIAMGFVDPGALEGGQLSVWHVGMTTPCSIGEFGRYDPQNELVRS